MVYRHQVSLTVRDESTSTFIDDLKRGKQLKPQIVKFLDKYASNPQMVEAWLQDDGSEEDVTFAESDKLVKLKSSLELYKAFLGTVKLQNEANVDNFTDYLTSEEFARFRTEFEKSEQGYNDTILIEGSEIGSKQGETNDLEKEVKTIKDDVNELKMLLQQTLTTNDSNLGNTKIMGTSPASLPLSVAGSSEDSLSEYVEETENSFEEDEVIQEQLVEEVDEETDEIQQIDVLEVGVSETEDSEDSNSSDASEALDILSSMQL